MCATKWRTPSKNLLPSMHKLLLKELQLETLSKWARLATASPPAKRIPSALPPEVDIHQLSHAELKTHVSGCQNCPLAQSRTQTVFARGKYSCGSIMVIGEAPGAEEDKQGLPFVGQAGILLDSILAALDLPQEHNVYITNIVKCRPPQNRDPSPKEIDACSSYLLRQIELLEPLLLITAGKVASQTLLGSDLPMHQLRQTIHDCHGHKLVAIYHPAYFLRNPLEKSKVWEDLQLIRRALATA